MEDAALHTIDTASRRDPEFGRGNTLGRALWFCDWLQQRRFPFTALDLAREMEATKRTALRWLEVAEGVGLVACDRSRSTWRWSSCRR